MGLSVHLQKALGRFTLDVAWEIGNELAVIFGPSGSGKSLTLQLLAGLMKPDQGFIRVDGKTFFDSMVKSVVPPQDRSFGYVFQDLALFPHMTVEENIRYGAAEHPRSLRDKRMREMLDIFHLDGLEKKLPSEISGGQKQRVAFARALIRKPDVLLLDEPFTSLDTSLRLEMRNVLKDIWSEFNVPVILVTHDIFDARALADTVIVYADGKVVRTGTPRDIFNMQLITEGDISLLISSSPPRETNAFLTNGGKQTDMGDQVIVLKGGGDIGTGVAHRFHTSGFRVLILELENPMVIRRTVAFAQAVFEGKTVVERVKAVRADTEEEIQAAWKKGNIPVCVDPTGSMTTAFKPDVFIDATIAKRNTGLHRGMAPITIALGPGFTAGVDCDAVIETNRGPNLGKVIFSGSAEPNTGIPGPVLGYEEERVLRSPCRGKVRHVLDIGDTARKSDTVCYVGSEAVKASLDGVIRGLIAEGIEVPEGLKIGDIDPRGIKESCYIISDKARIIGAAVLEAIRVLKSRMLIE
ncbi:MAG: selenium-dependent molybdenum cofactor biosynthesis protein YqeB [Proteobacteria bacterium]|nr:selenium-dependent molybdenum cofactor biosynthesis protein YqeB [Pseudomonadota bacterium]